MEILEAFALTNSYRAAGELAGCSHHTVEHWVMMRDKGLLPDGARSLERVKLTADLVRGTRQVVQVLCGLGLVDGGPLGGELAWG